MWKVILFILVVFIYVNCCDLCFKFLGYIGIVYCIYSIRCVKVLNGYVDKWLWEVCVRNCNVIVVLSFDFFNIDIKDWMGKRCYGKYFFFECMNNV